MTTYQPVEQSLVEEESDLTLFGSRSRSTGSWINQDNIREVQRFNDFRTIDWVEDELDAQKKRVLKARHITSRGNNMKDKIISQAQNWVVLGIMGCSIGLIAGSLNIITSFLSNIRTGHCKRNFILTSPFVAGVKRVTTATIG